MFLSQPFGVDLYLSGVNLFNWDEQTECETKRLPDFQFMSECQTLLLLNGDTQFYFKSNNIEI